MPQTPESPTAIGGPCSERRQLEDVLLACLRAESGESAAAALERLDASGCRDLARLARRLRVAPLLGWRLRQSYIGLGDLSTRLRNQVHRTAAENLRKAGALRAIAGAFREAGIACVALKGAYLAEAVYRELSVRPMSDLDLLVPLASAEAAARTLRELGYRSEAAGDDSVAAKGLKHLPEFRDESGDIVVELHCHVTSPGEPGHIDVAELWTRSQPVTLAGAQMLALAPEDLLLVLCAHVAYEHEFEFDLRPFCDVAQVTRCCPIDWDAVLERARRWRWERGVYMTLRLAAEWVAAPVPADVLQGLAPPGAHEAICETVRARVFGRESADEARFSHRSYLARFWEAGSWPDRLRLAAGRLFLDRSTIGALYGVDPSSLRILGCYAWRLRDLLLQFAPVFKDLALGDESPRRLMRDKASIACWLTGE